MTYYAFTQKQIDFITKVAIARPALFTYRAQALILSHHQSGRLSDLISYLKNELGVLQHGLMQLPPIYCLSQYIDPDKNSAFYLKKNGI